MKDLLQILFGGCLGALIGSILSYYFGLKQVLNQVKTQAKIELYKELFDKIRNMNTTTAELNNLICNSQIFVSDEIITFLNNLDINEGIKVNDIQKLLTLIRADLGFKRRDLTIHTIHTAV